MIKKTVASSILCVFLNSNAQAATATGVVEYAGVYGSGRLFISLDTEISQTGCPSNRIDIEANHPQIDRWLSVAMVSASAKIPITVSATGCFGSSYVTIDTTTNGWIYLDQR